MYIRLVIRDLRGLVKIDTILALSNGGDGNLGGVYLGRGEKVDKTGT